MEHKIVIKPFNHGDEIDKSRSITGIKRWARSSKPIGMLMKVMGWFAIPDEVFFRKNFGQRWFTPIAFYSGLVLGLLFYALQYGWIYLETHGIGLLSWLGPFNPLHFKKEKDEYDYNNEALFQLFLIFYIPLGLYHLFKIKWRIQARKALHSFDDGTSRLWWLAKPLMWLLNLLSFLPMFVYFNFIPPNERAGTKQPKLVTDVAYFANVIVEPAFIIFLLFLFKVTGIARAYMVITTVSVLVHAHWKESARKTKLLDFQDSKVAAEQMRNLKINSTTKTEKLIKIASKMPDSLKPEWIKPKRKKWDWDKTKAKLEALIAAKQYKDMRIVLTKEWDNAYEQERENYYWKLLNEHNFWGSPELKSEPIYYPKLNSIIEQFHSDFSVPKQQ